MLKFYLSPSGLSYFEYRRTCRAIAALGWTPTWSWPAKSFAAGFKPTKDLSEMAVTGISQAELFIAILPGNIGTQFEIGLAYAWCQELALAARDKVYFGDSTLANFHHAVLPGITRFVCSLEQLPARLRSYYLYLVAN